MPDVKPSDLLTASQEYVKSLETLQKDLESKTGIMGKVFGAIGQFFTGFLPHIGKSILAILPQAWEYTKAQFQDSVKQSFHNVYAPLIDKMVEQGRISKELGDFIANMTGTVAPFSDIIAVIAALLVILGDSAGVMAGVLDDSRQKVRGIIRNTLPDAASAVQAMFINPELEAEVRTILRRYGLNDERAEMMISSARNQLDPATVQALLWRGEITEEEAVRRLRALGYTDSSGELLRKTWNVIPGPQDIIRMAVREAFSPEQVSSLGLDEAFPAEVSEWAAKVGLKDPWPKMFWRAHWELPSPSMGFEMLHRGQISEAELSGLLKALDYSPVWHERLKAIAYNVVTRVDARRLYDLGIWTEEQLTDAYRKMGYSPSDADDLTAWTKVEYGQNDKEITRSTVESAYRAGVINRREAVNMIVELGWSEEKAEWILDLADFKSLSEARDQAVATAKELYLAGVESGAEVRERLGKEQVQADYIEALIERWDAEKLSKRKLPSKSDLDKFLKAALIQEAEYKAELERLGYSAEMADRYYRLNTKESA